MNEGEIRLIMKTDFFLKNECWGVFARDEVPNTLLPGGYVINTEDRGEPGQHWIAIWVNKTVEFMDSFGFKPEHYGWHFNLPTYYNSSRIQRLNTDTCGAFCIYFLYYKCRNITMYDILNECTEEIVTNFIQLI